MELPLQISFHEVPHSDALEQWIRRKAEGLERYAPHLMRCRVVVEAHHRHHQQGGLFRIRIELTVPGHDVVVSSEQHERQEHENPYVAVRDAFRAARRQLEDTVRRVRGATKAHELAEHGRIVAIFPHMDYGLISAGDGREIYFHRNSVVGQGLEDLVEGEEVRVVVAEGEGEAGPQASTVKPIGKHHLVDRGTA